MCYIDESRTHKFYAPTAVIVGIYKYNLSRYFHNNNITTISVAINLMY